MPGLNLKVGGYGGVSSGKPASWSSEPGASSVTQAAFGPGASVPMESPASILAPNDGFGSAVTVGVIAVAILVFVRHSLPR
jgi:hypothetical protein